jgi:hypothetical protein
MGAIEGTFKHMATFRIAAQMIAYQTVQAIEVLPHIRRAGCNIYPRCRSKAEHRLRPVQYGQQALQCPRIESTTHFNPPSASRLNYQNTIAPGVAMCIPDCRRNQFNRKQGPATRSPTTPHALTIFVQRPHSHATLLAKSLPLQSTRFKLRNQRIGLGPTSPLPNLSNFAHNSSASLNKAA